MNIQDHTPDFLSVKEVSEILKVSEKTTYKLFHSGEFNVLRLGGKKLYVRKKDFLNWCDNNFI